MPRYCFVCECGHRLELYQSYSEQLPDLCPNCGAKEGEGFHQDYSFNVWVYGNQTTIGQIAEANEKKLGKEQMQKMVEAENKRLPAKPDKVPWWREGTSDITKPLNLKEIKDINHYVMTGEKTLNG